MIGLLLLAGCATPPATETPPALPPTLTIALTPALRPWLPSVQECVRPITDTAVFIQEAAYPAPEPVDLHLHLGEPAELSPFAAQIGFDSLVVILNRNHPGPTPDLTAIKALYTGAAADWGDEDATPVSLWALMPGDETRAHFDHFVLGDARLNTNTRLAGDAAQMLAVVQDDPAAIGYLPVTAVGTANMEIVFTGIELPLLALADSEPQGTLLQIVACLQGTP